MSGDLQLRPATADDSAFLAWALDEAAGGIFTAMFGARSTAILTRVMAQLGHQLSHQHATVAIVDGEVRGFCQGWPPGTPPADAALIRAASVWTLRAAVVAIAAWPVVAALGRHSAGDWYLQAIAVTPRERGSGVGRSLFADALNRAAGAGCATLSLDVDTANLRAQAFYERRGLQVVSTSPRARLLGDIQVHRMSVTLAPQAAPHLSPRQ